MTTAEKIFLLVFIFGVGVMVTAEISYNAGASSVNATISNITIAIGALGFLICGKHDRE